MYTCTSEPFATLVNSLDSLGRAVEETGAFYLAISPFGCNTSIPPCSITLWGSVLDLGGGWKKGCRVIAQVAVFDWGKADVVLYGKEECRKQNGLTHEEAIAWLKGVISEELDSLTQKLTAARNQIPCPEAQ